MVSLMFSTGRFRLSATMATDSGRPTCLMRSEEHTSELQSRLHLVCRLLLENKIKMPRLIDAAVGIGLGSIALDLHTAHPPVTLAALSATPPSPPNDHRLEMAPSFRRDDEER